MDSKVNWLGVSEGEWFFAFASVYGIGESNWL